MTEPQPCVDEDISYDASDDPSRLAQLGDPELLRLLEEQEAIQKGFV